MTDVNTAVDVDDNMAGVPQVNITHALLAGTVPTTPTSIIRAVPRGGVGLIAARKIDRGMRICEEAPALVMEAPQRMFTSDAARAAVQSLPPAKRALFYTLHNADPRSPNLPFNILLSNGFVMDDKNMGIFIGLSRINHACNHNAHAAWCPNLRRMVVHALREIAPNEEIFISYISKCGDLPLVRDARRALLMRQRKFLCTCNMCMLPPNLAEASDSRILEAHAIHVASELNVQSPTERLRSNRRMLEMLNNDRVGYTYAPKVYASMALLCAACSDMARSRVFFSMAASAAKIVLGLKHPVTQSHLAWSHTPSSHHMAEIWTRWQSSQDEIPRAFADKQVFDDWLWRAGLDEIPEFPAKYADLADANFARPFKELPVARVFDPNLFFHGPNGKNDLPLIRRSWVYVGEIVEVQTHPVMTLKVRDHSHQPGDEDGTVIFVDMNDGKGFFPNGPPSVGTTLGLAYPIRDTLNDGTVAVSVIMHNEFTIFPVDMAELMEVNEQVKTYASLHGGLHRCHTCGESHAFLACDGCGMFYYCDEQCRERSHNGLHQAKHCELLQNKDLRTLFWTDFEEWDGLKVFSGANLMGGGQAVVS